MKIKIILLFLFLSCTEGKEIQPAISKEASSEEIPSSTSYNEQISCREKECAKIYFETISELDEKIKCPKILVNF
jgi:hypothetical protein